jgi:hypothetical protein
VASTTSYSMDVPSSEPDFVGPPPSSTLPTQPINQLIPKKRSLLSEQHV